MPISFYMDHNVPKAITLGLRIRGVDILTAFEDEADQSPDHEIICRATKLNRVLFSQDQDFLELAATFQSNKTHFSGLIFARQRKVSIGKCIDDLELIAKAGSEDDFVNIVVHLPL